MSTTEFGVTRDGIVQLRRRWPLAPGVRARAAMVLVHGIAEHSGRYEHVGARLAAAGIDAVAIDLRGFGLSGGRRSFVGSFDEYVDDVRDQLEQVRALGLPTVLFGHSMGGLVALSAVVDRPVPRPDALVLSAPALGADVPALLRMAAPVLARFAPRLRLPNPVRPAQLASDPAVGAAYLADPLVVRTTTPALGAALLAQMRLVHDLLPALDVPTLVQHGGDDTLVPTASSEVLAGRRGVVRLVYPGLRHEILQEPARDLVIDEMLAWLRRTIPELRADD